MPSKIEIVGQKFGRALVLRNGERRSTGRRSVDCLCDCGAEFNCDPRLLLSGKTKSCGCYHRDAVSFSASHRGGHSMSGTPEYNSWIKMRSRCANDRDSKYPDYGGRGITVCARWDASFADFFADMGPKPSADASIDRVNVDGDYEPSNCRWATPFTQARNKRSHRFVFHEGKRMPLSEACALSSVNYRSAIYRLNTGKDWMPIPSPPVQT